LSSSLPNIKGRRRPYVKSSATGTVVEMIKDITLLRSDIDADVDADANILSLSDKTSTKMLSFSKMTLPMSSSPVSSFSTTVSTPVSMAAKAVDKSMISDMATLSARHFEQNNDKFQFPVSNGAELIQNTMTGKTGDSDDSTGYMHTNRQDDRQNNSYANIYSSSGSTNPALSQLGNSNSPHSFISQHKSFIDTFPILQNSDTVNQQGMMSPGFVDSDHLDTNDKENSHVFANHDVDSHQFYHTLPPKGTCLISRPPTSSSQVSVFSPRPSSTSSVSSVTSLSSVTSNMFRSNHSTKFSTLNNNVDSNNNTKMSSNKNSNGRHHTNTHAHQPSQQQCMFDDQGQLHDKHWLNHESDMESENGSARISISRDATSRGTLYSRDNKNSVSRESFSRDSVSRDGSNQSFSSGSSCASLSRESTPPDRLTLFSDNVNMMHTQNMQHNRVLPSGMSNMPRKLNVIDKILLSNQHCDEVQDTISLHSFAVTTKTSISSTNSFSDVFVSSNAKISSTSKSSKSFASGAHTAPLHRHSSSGLDTNKQLIV
jgi:hypothetical protein